MNKICYIAFITLFLAQAAFAGGYTAFDIHKSVDVSEQEAPYILGFIVLLFVYYFLKVKNNKFINKYEGIILPILFVVVPVLLGIIFVIINK